MKDNTNEPLVMSEVDISRVGALLADSARAAMLVALRGDRAFPAGGTGAVCRYQCLYREYSPDQAHGCRMGYGRAMWTTSLLPPSVATRRDAVRAVHVRSCTLPAPPLTAGRERHEQPQHHELRLARTCYDHLAGELGVALTDALVQKGVVELADKDYTLTERGKALLLAWGVDVVAALGQRRAFARRCLDWTERRDHLGGALGATICNTWLAHGWVQRHEQGRALLITQHGMEQLQVWGVALPPV